MDNETSQLDYHAIGARYVREVDGAFVTVKTASDIALILKIQAMSELEAMRVVEMIEENPLSVCPSVYALIRSTFPSVEALALNFNTFKQLERMKVKP